MVFMLNRSQPDFSRQWLFQLDFLLDSVFLLFLDQKIWFGFREPSTKFNNCFVLSAERAANELPMMNCTMLPPSFHNFIWIYVKKLVFPTTDPSEDISSNIIKFFHFLILSCLYFLGQRRENTGWVQFISVILFVDILHTLWIHSEKNIGLLINS